MMLKFLILALVFNFASGEIPSFIKLCKRNDPDLTKCYADSMKDILSHLREGIPQVGLPALEPLFLETVTFSDNAFARLQVRGKLFNTSIYNTSYAEIDKVTIDLDKFHFTMDATFPMIRIVTICETKGKLMLFELDSTGDLELNITNMVTTTEWFGEIVTKNGKKHGHITDVKLTIKNSKIRFHMSDLFKDNPELTETFNTVINENMDNLYEDFRPLFEEVLSGIIVTYGNALYDKLSLDELYPPS